jgi:hypothetical protein
MGDFSDNIGNPPEFCITIEEAKALNYFLKLHHGLLKQSPDEYEQILRLINGLGTFLDKHD